MDSPTSPETVEPIIQDSPIFDPEIYDVLPNIINHLDPASFVKFARTCKAMNFTCFNNNNRIKIPCWHWGSAIGGACVSILYEATNIVLITNKHYQEHSADSEFMKKLSKMPFVYEVDLEIGIMVDDRLLREMRNFLSNFPRVIIPRLQVYADIGVWEGVVEVIKDYRVAALYAPFRYVDDRNVEEPSLEALSFLTRNLSEFTCQFYIPDDIILRATARNMDITEARISKETFKELTKRFAAGEIFSWAVGREEAVEDELDPFIVAVSEAIKTVKVEAIDGNLMEPSTAYFTPSEPGKFHILKPNGPLCYIVVLPSYVQFIHWNF